MTFGRLWKTSDWAKGTTLLERPKSKVARTKVSWTLYVGADRLVQRAVSTYGFLGTSLKLTSDIRYVRWGSPVSIKAPAPGQVAQVSDLDGGELPDSDDLILTPGGLS